MQCLLEAKSGVQLPPPCDRFWIFFVGPGIIYTLDKIISLRTRYMELDIIETELLPSDVVKVKFYRYVPGSKYFPHGILIIHFTGSSIRYLEQILSL